MKPIYFAMPASRKRSTESKSAKRLATWGKVYDNEDLARKAKTMFARKERLEEEQTELTEGTPWALQLQGESMPANRLLEVLPFGNATKQ